MNIEICETIKIENDFSTNWMRLRTAITKKKTLRKNEIDDHRDQQKNEHWRRKHSLHDLNEFEHRSIHDHYAYDLWFEKDDV